MLQNSLQNVKIHFFFIVRAITEISVSFPLSQLLELLFHCQQPHSLVTRNSLIHLPPKCLKYFFIPHIDQENYCSISSSITGIYFEHQNTEILSISTLKKKKINHWNYSFTPYLQIACFYSL